MISLEAAEAPSSPEGASSPVLWAMLTIRQEPDALRFRIRTKSDVSPVAARLLGVIQATAKREVEVMLGETPIRKMAIERIHKCRLCTFQWGHSTPEAHAPGCPAAPPKED